MSIEANVETIVQDLEGFWTDITTNVVGPVATAVAAGGKNISADLTVVGAAVTAISTAVAKIPGNVGVQVATYTPIAVSLIDFFEGIFSGSSSTSASGTGAAAPATVTAAAKTLGGTPPTGAATGDDGLGDNDADTGAL